MRLRSLVVVIAFSSILVAGLSIGVSATDDLERARAHKIVALWEFADAQENQAALAAHLDVMKYLPGQSIKFITDAESLARLQDQGYNIQILDPDIVKTYQSRLAPTSMGGYRTLDEIVLGMDTLHTLNPTISTAKFSIGQTIQGREMWVMKISDNPDVDEDEPEIFFNAATHAREVITPLILLETMRALIEGYGVDPRITDLVNEREIFFLPCLNADGYRYNQQIEPNGGGMWRKNRRNNGDFTYGIDLNRNFSYMWGFDDVGSSPVTGDETYRGPSPASEPEIQNVMTFTESRCNPSDVVYLVNHVYKDDDPPTGYCD